jgi:ATP adenylyltransferase
LQVVPLPLGGAPTGTPFESAFATAGLQLSPLSDLPFRHVAVRLDDLAGATDEALAARAYRLYLDALRSLERDPEAPGAYNLVVTRQLLCVVPRVREHYAHVSVNALGFCGVLLAVDDEDLSLLRQSGPLEVLRGVAG